VLQKESFSPPLLSATHLIVADKDGGEGGGGVEG